jgi:hypothetical protein
MRTLLAITLAAAFALPVSGAVIPKQSKGNIVSVAVTYAGKGAVDATREIWVFLFDTPAIGQGVRPLSVTTIKKSGETATFRNVTQDPVYVAVAYDDKGAYDGNLAPPPPGMPIAYYIVDGKPTASPIKTTGGATIKLTFSDRTRMQ